MLVDDQIQQKEASGLLDELSKRINKLATKDVAAGINMAEHFQAQFLISKENDEVQQTNVDSENLSKKDIEER